MHGTRCRAVRRWYHMRVELGGKAEPWASDETAKAQAGLRAAEAQLAGAGDFSFEQQDAARLASGARRPRPRRPGREGPPAVARRLDAQRRRPAAAPPAADAPSAGPRRHRRAQRLNTQGH
ncbi:hypothetical protein DIPPA_15429 [Diplonema papillatum]|nr:hypothetical protein DIPPA_15429 [Diplonema papillatum]